MPVKTATEQELAEFPFEQKSVSVNGKKFVFRELSVQENDSCADDAKGTDGSINGRTMMRLMIIASSVEPKLSVKVLGSMPQRAYAKIYETVNELNDPATLPDEGDDQEGNA